MTHLAGAPDEPIRTAAPLSTVANREAPAATLPLG